MQISDSDALAYLQSNLAHIEPTFWERKYTPIVYQDLIPVSAEAGPHVTSIEVHYMDSTAEGKFVGSAGDDINFARVTTGRDQIKVRYGGIGYEYTIEELRQAAALNRPLDKFQANAARRGFEEHAQRIAFEGDSSAGLEGLLNHSDVPTASAASSWATALGTDVDTLLGLINHPINAIITDTNGQEIPDTMLIGLARFNTIATTRMNTVSDTTVLEYIRQKNAATARTGVPLTIIPIPQLTTKMVVYSRNPDVMVMHIPLPLAFHPPQMQNLKVRIPGEYKLAGVEMRFPKAVAYRTGI